MVGLDVVRDAAELRERIGLAGQYAAVDENLTGLENLTMVGRLYGTRRARGQGARRRSCSSASTSSTRRAARPRPTRAACAAGSTSPPRSSPSRRCCSSTSRRPASTRAAGWSLWDVIEELVAEGTTVLLTTQYLDEADRLADTIAVIDHGRVIAEGTLRRAQGPRRRRAPRGHASTTRADVEAAVEALAPMSDEPPTVDGRPGVRAACASARGAIVEAVRRLERRRRRRRRPRRCAGRRSTTCS